MSLVTNSNILTERELRQLRDSARQLLAVKATARIWVKASCGIYIVQLVGAEEKWTFNESQALAWYNAA